MEGFELLAGGNIPGGGLKVINAIIAAGLSGTPKGSIPGGGVNVHDGTIAGMLVRGGAPIGNGALGNLPDLYAAVV